MSAEPILQTKEIRKEFGSLVAVDGISVEFRRAENVGIIGPNGAGKSTFVNLISGALDLTDGSVVFNGEDISSLKRYQRVRKGLVRSFQLPQVYEELTVFENIQASVISRNKDNNQVFVPVSSESNSVNEAEEILRMFNLHDEANLKAESLPHGDRKVLDVAMAFAQDPKLILLDEPTSGVGSEKKNQVMKTIVEVAQQKEIGLIFIEHDMELIRQYSDRVIALHEGRLLNAGQPEEILDSDEVNEFILEGGV